MRRDTHFQLQSFGRHQSRTARCGCGFDGAGSLPIDMALRRDSRFLYVRGGNGTVGGFRVEADGSLTRVTSAIGVPSGAQGIAA